jgi:hypothetical protein
VVSQLSMKACGFGVAVAVAVVADPELGEPGPKAVVKAEP